MPSHFTCLLRSSLTGLIASGLLACAAGTTADGTAASGPSASATTRPATAWPHGAMVSAANPYATDAAIAVLRDGGSAVDAAIASHLVLGLVEPQSSGIGGGAFMLAYERTNDVLRVYDGRETAPAGARADMFVEDGSAINFLAAWQSGRAVGVPGAVALYKLAHDRHGVLPWSALFAPAIALARDGFVVSPRLHGLLVRVRRVSELDDHAASAEYFYPGGEPLAVGTRRDNPAYADLLARIANEGPAAFYRGAVAADIAAAAQAEPRGGTLSVADLAGYRALERDPVCGAYRHWRICSAPPPSSGLAQIAIAGLYARLTNGRADVPADEAVRAMVDAQRLAYADRDHFVGDPAFADVPAAALIDPHYLDARATQRFAPDAPARHGNPAAVLGRAANTWWFANDSTTEANGTTHLSIIDGNGNAVSMTATVEAPFGSSRLVHGFLLNNEMTDFARDPGADDAPPANLVAAGKRPRSSMSPTMIFDNDRELHVVTGSPGGNSIVAYVAKSIIGVLDWKLSASDAVEFPNIIARGDTIRVEVANEHGKRLADMLTAAGYAVQEREGENSGLHMIVVRPDGLEGAADSRREGVVKRLPGQRQPPPSP